MKKLKPGEYEDVLVFGPDGKPIIAHRNGKRWYGYTLLEWLNFEPSSFIPLDRVTELITENAALCTQLDVLRGEISKNYIPCPHCDFSSGQRGMDTCGKCDGTGRISVIDRLVEERETARRIGDRMAAENALIQAESGQLRRERDTAIEYHVDNGLCPSNTINYCVKAQLAEDTIEFCRQCWREALAKQTADAGKEAIHG